MASGKYEAFSILVLNWLFNGGTFAQPSNLYVALFSVTPSVSTTGTEATGSGDNRVKLLKPVSVNPDDFLNGNNGPPLT